MLTVPLPVQPDNVTDLVAAPAPPMFTVGQVAPPVVFCVTFPLTSDTVFTPLPPVSEKLSVKLVGLADRTKALLGAPMETTGLV